MAGELRLHVLVAADVCFANKRTCSIPWFLVVGRFEVRERPMLSTATAARNRARGLADRKLPWTFN
jgi:hypothetical protein